MFRHFNYWYATLLLSVLLMFIYGFRERYADGCRVRERAHLSARLEVGIWAYLSVFNIICAVRESYRGFFATAERMLGGRGDGLDVAVVAMGGMILFALLVFGLLFFAGLIGEVIGSRNAETKARNYRCACRGKSRPDACRECSQPRQFNCPVGIDRSPSWILDLDELQAKLQTYQQGGYPIDGSPVYREILPSGTETIIIDAGLKPTYAEQSPRRLTPPPEFKVGGCVTAIFAIALPRTTTTEQ